MLKSRGEPAVETPGGSVALGSLTPEQLERLQTDLQREVEMISSSLSQLTSAVARLTASKENATQINTMEDGKEVMVPLTSSIYVPGRLAASKKVLIDIGTGFFIEKSPAAAETHFARRATLLKDESDKATQVHTQKRQQLEAVSAVLQRKTAETAAAKKGVKK